MIEYILGLILIALAGIGYICYHYLSKLMHVIGRPVIIEQPVEDVKGSALLGDTVLHTN